MGFLLGAYGKLAAGSRYRSLQARLMRVQSRLRRATRDASEMEKMIDRQEKRALNALTAQTNGAVNIAMQQIASSTGAAALLGSTDFSGMTSEQQQAIAAYNTQSASVKGYSETWLAAQKEAITNYYEQMRDEMLEPLKDEEDLLQGEKDSLESQIQVAKADYDACKQMEKADAQMMKPEYTAGGQG